ncbi:unnamed protein product [Pedinophyceae sp. YPF-701]|nr:unnamed protein product [Pedinophyceae sp. YPF-701]
MNRNVRLTAATVAAGLSTIIGEVLLSTGASPMVATVSMVALAGASLAASWPAPNNNPREHKADATSQNIVVDASRQYFLVLVALSFWGFAATAVLAVLLGPSAAWTVTDTDVDGLRSLLRALDTGTAYISRMSLLRACLCVAVLGQWSQQERQRTNDCTGKCTHVPATPRTSWVLSQHVHFISVSCIVALIAVPHVVPEHAVALVPLLTSNGGVDNVTELALHPLHTTGAGSRYVERSDSESARAGWLPTSSKLRFGTQDGVVGPLIVARLAVQDDGSVASTEVVMTRHLRAHFWPLLALTQTQLLLTVIALLFATRVALESSDAQPLDLLLSVLSFHVESLADSEPQCDERPSGSGSSGTDVACLRTLLERLSSAQASGESISAALLEACSCSPPAVSQRIPDYHNMLDKRTADWIVNQYTSEGIDSLPKGCESSVARASSVSDSRAGSCDDGGFDPRREEAPLGCGTLNDRQTLFGNDIMCGRMSSASVADPSVDMPRRFNSMPPLPSSCSRDEPLDDSPRQSGCELSFAPESEVSPLNVEWAGTIFDLQCDQLLAGAMELFASTGVFETGYISRRRTAKLLHVISQAYSEHNAYHNIGHAVDVAHTTHLLLAKAQPRLQARPLEKFAVLLAAVAHDVGHPGVNNAFLVATRHPLATRYNGRSVLENHHASTLFEAMELEPEADIFVDLQKSDARSMRSLIIDCILLTDMASHFEMINNLHVMARRSRKSQLCRTVYAPDGQSAGADRAFDDRDRRYIFAVLLHLADIGPMLKPGTLGWSERVLHEFFEQGDREASLGLPISPMMDRAEVKLAYSQMKFVEFVLWPLLEPVVGVLPELTEVTETLVANYLAWVDLAAEEGSADGAALQSAAREFQARAKAVALQGAGDLARMREADKRAKIRRSSIGATPLGVMRNVAAKRVLWNVQQ